MKEVNLNIFFEYCFVQLHVVSYLALKNKNGRISSSILHFFEDYLIFLPFRPLAGTTAEWLLGIISSNSSATSLASVIIKELCLIFFSEPFITLSFLSFFVGLSTILFFWFFQCCLIKCFYLFQIIFLLTWVLP